MKFSIAIICLVLFSCDSLHYQNVNNLRGQPANITFKNGQSAQGNVRMQSMSDYSGIKEVLFAEGNTTNYTSYSILDIDQMFYNGSTYAVRRIVGPEMFGGNGIRFIKQITQPNKNGFNLFEAESKDTRNDGKIITELHLYIQLPGNSDVYDAQSDWFIPKFDEKMNLYFQDCPSLFQKITNKQKGYFYALVNQGEIQRKQVWMNIWNDYNNCK